jgi:predicted nucleic acid-binding protein
MNVLVDTSVWSLALRRATAQDSAVVAELRELIREGRVEIMGAIRQELLSGVREPSQFESLRAHLRAFPDLVLGSADFGRPRSAAIAAVPLVCRDRIPTFCSARLP